MRYEPVRRYLDARRATQVLDVGSGWFGLSWYWPHDVVQTDLNFEGQPALGGRQGQAVFIRSTAQALPFRDATFEYVVCLDVLEHLPVTSRAPAVRELLRVAREGVLIGFPCGERARQMDRVLQVILRRRGRNLPPWLAEHLEQPAYPDRATVEAGLDQRWRIMQEIPNGNALLQLLVVLAEHHRVSARIASRLERGVAARGLPRWTSRGGTMRTIFVLEAPRAAQA